MANVTTYLNKILSAVYGKDVRQVFMTPSMQSIRRWKDMCLLRKVV